MFKFGQKPTFSYTVSVSIPADGGRVNKLDFDAEFKRLSSDEYGEWVGNLTAASAQGTSAIIQAQKDCARKVMAGWGKVVDEADQFPTPRAICDAYMESQSMVGRAKN
jgi:hypothetical protein